MLLLDNLRIRFREWNDQSDDPDLVPRLRRLWRARADAPAANAAQARPQARFLLAAAHAARIRRAS